jgi:DNA-binding response OmpR family regulator
VPRPLGTVLALGERRHGAGPTYIGTPAPCQRFLQKAGVTVPRVLVVDDEANHARVIAIGLRIEGFDVETAGNAEETFRLLAAQDFDLAVVDLMMPGTNGIQLARLLRERYPHTRVVLTSAYHLSERQLVRADCGAVAFVPKPFDVTDLARFLRSKLGAESGPFETRGVGSAGSSGGHRPGPVARVG